jgi:hypothetical protein
MQKSDFRSTGIYVEPLGKNDTQFSLIDSTGQKIKVKVQGDLEVTGDISAAGSSQGYINLDRYYIPNFTGVINPNMIKPFMFSDNTAPEVTDYYLYKFSPLPLEFQGRTFTIINRAMTGTQRLFLIATNNTGTTPDQGVTHRGTVRFHGKYDYYDVNSSSWKIKNIDKDVTDPYQGSTTSNNRMEIYGKNAFTFYIDTNLMPGYSDRYDTVLYLVSTAGPNKNV